MDHHDSQDEHSETPPLLNEGSSGLPFAPRACPMRLFCSTVLRQDNDGFWFLMNRAATGWSSMAFGPYMSLDDVRAAFDVVLGRAGEDSHGTYREARPR